MGAGMIGAIVLAARAHAYRGPEASLGWLGAAVLVLACGIPFIIQWYYRQTSEYVLTTRRVIVGRGLWTRTTREVFLNRVSGVDVEQTLPGRLGNFGTVVVMGFAGPQDVFQNIEDPNGFRMMVEQQLASNGRRS
jgi:uncharacterized membrane protein YdbT with pleckstrin-like domain